MGDIGENRYHGFDWLPIFCSGDGDPSAVCCDVDRIDWAHLEGVRLGGSVGTPVIEENYELLRTPENQHFGMVGNGQFEGIEGEGLTDFV